MTGYPALEQNQLHLKSFRINAKFKVDKVIDTLLPDFQNNMESEIKNIEKEYNQKLVDVLIKAESTKADVLLKSISDCNRNFINEVDSNIRDTRNINPNLIPSDMNESLNHYISRANEIKLKYKNDTLILSMKMKQNLDDAIWKEKLIIRLTMRMNITMKIYRIW